MSRFYRQKSGVNGKKIKCPWGLSLVENDGRAGAKHAGSFYILGKVEGEIVKRLLRLEHGEE
jgi:hypothetical protein